ncbi:MAG: histone H1 [Bacteroides sp.]|nr:histone H1 [Bacteroides sp.]
MKELLEEISAHMETFRENAKSQLDKGNKSAGLRARRASLDLEPLLKRFRKLSLEASNPNLAN